MSDNSTQEQLNEINSKLDLLMNYVIEERLKRKEIEDFMSDISIIGKDVYKSTVDELEKRNCNFEFEKLKEISFKLMRNIDHIDQMTDFLFQISDLMKEMAPIGNEMILDFSHKLDEYNKKGYFEYLQNWMEVIKEFQKQYTINDVQTLKGNIEPIVSITRQLTSPGVINGFEKIVNAIESINIDEEKDNKSLFKLFKEINSKEVRKSLSYMLRIIKTINN